MDEASQRTGSSVVESLQRTRDVMCCGEVNGDDTDGESELKNRSTELGREEI